MQKQAQRFGTDAVLGVVEEDVAEAQAEAGERLSQLNAAYAILSKPYKKASYDSKLKKRRTSYSEPRPEYCNKCGKPTLYWQAGRDARQCNECER